MSTMPEQSLPAQPGGLRSILKSQYHAALAMLRESIERCPDDLWYSREPVNAFWQVAYHTLFYTHLYLQPNEAAFRPWEHHRSEAQHPDALGGSPDPASDLPLIPDPYSKTEVLAYWTVCSETVDAAVDALDLDAESSGFSWYQMPKLEHQLVSIRHIQHHAAQLADRLRSSVGIGIQWIGARHAG